MSRIVAFLLGALVGALVAVRAGGSQRGASLVATLDARIDQFQTAVIDGYKAREAELRAAEEAADAAADPTDRTK
jgi:hypothetical protein